MNSLFQIILEKHTLKSFECNQD